MSPTLLKYCPHCEAENAPSESFCESCGFDLLNVEVEGRRNSGVARSVAAPVESGDQGDGAGAVAPVAPATGSVDSAPAGGTAAANVAWCRLELIEDPAFGFRVAAGQVVGRSAEADVVLSGIPNLEYISRRHAKFLRRGDQWFVMYIAEGNYIKVDGEEYENDDEVALHEGSILTLSLSSFRVGLT